MPSENNKCSETPLVTFSKVAPSNNFSLPSLEPCDGQQTNNVGPTFRSLEHDKENKESDALLSPNYVPKAINGKSKVTQEQKKGDDKNPKIPDGGWGWLVVLASLVIALVADGVGFSYGLLQIEFRNEFKCSNAVTSWIGSLLMAVPLLTGPIMSAFVDKYGCRSMTILGGVISTIGFFGSSFAESIAVMYLTFGVLTGLGLGLCFVTSVVAVAFWFEKRRTLAVSIGACGTGIGTFVYAPLTTYLLQEYRWRGTVMLLAGTFSHICVCGALMRDPDWIIEQDKLEAKLAKSSKSSTLSLSSNNASSLVDLNEIRKLLDSGKDAEYILQTLVTSINNEEIIEPKEYHSSVVNLPTFVKDNEKVPVEVLELLCSNKRLYNIILENYPSLLTCRSTSERSLIKLTEDNSVIPRIPVKLSVKVKKSDKAKSEHHVSIIEDEKPSVQQSGIDDIEKQAHAQIGRQMSVKRQIPMLRACLPLNPIHAYFRNMKLRTSTMAHHGTPFNSHKYRIRASSCPNMYKVSMMTLAKSHQEKWYAEFIELFEGMLDFSLFLELHFFLLSLSTIILFTWFIVPYFYLVDLLQQNNYSDTQAAFVLSTIGISNTIGMILLGWAGDQPWMHVEKTCAALLVVCGISLGAMLAFVSNYILIEIAATFFGLSLASSFSFTPVMIVNLVGLDRFTTAYGLSLLCQGIGNLIGPPLAGFLFDATDSWNQSFYQGTFWIAVSGILIGIIPYTKNRKIVGHGPTAKEFLNEQMK